MFWAVSQWNLTGMVAKLKWTLLGHKVALCYHCGVGEASPCWNPGIRAGWLCPGEPSTWLFSSVRGWTSSSVHAWHWVSFPLDAESLMRGQVWFSPLAVMLQCIQASSVQMWTRKKSSLALQLVWNNIQCACKHTHTFSGQAVQCVSESYCWSAFRTLKGKYVLMVQCVGKRSKLWWLKHYSVRGSSYRVEHFTIQRNLTDLSLSFMSQNIVHVHHLLKICVIQLVLELVPHLVSCNMDRFQSNR